MLLPSAIPCEIAVASNRPQRPKLLSLGSYVPQPQDFSPSSYTGGLFASCRALHSILGGTQPLQQSQAQNLGPSGTIKSSTARPSPFAQHKLQSPARMVTPPRGVNKRTRNEFEEDIVNKENVPQTPETRDMYQTPKRRRRIPVDMPRGLRIADFATLNSPVAERPLNTTPRREREEVLLMPPDEISGTIGRSVRKQNSPHSRRLSFRSTKAPIQTGARRHSLLDENQNLDQDPSEQSYDTAEAQEQWSPLDDRRLVEAVLSKLNLSKRDWNDCAKQLGKDKDSLGRRWKMLVGEGNIGLRRGIGRHERGDLDIKSW